MPKAPTNPPPVEPGSKESALAAIDRLRRMTPKNGVNRTIYEGDLKLVERFIQENGDPTILEVGEILANAAEDCFTNDAGVTVTSAERGRHGEAEFEIQFKSGAVYVVTIEEAD